MDKLKFQPLNEPDLVAINGGMGTPIPTWPLQVTLWLAKKIAEAIE